MTPCLTQENLEWRFMHKSNVCRERRQEKTSKYQALRQPPVRTKGNPRQATELPNCPEFRTLLPRPWLWTPPGTGHRASLATPRMSTDIHPNPLLETTIVCEIYHEWSQMPR